MTKARMLALAALAGGMLTILWFGALMPLRCELASSMAGARLAEAEHGSESQKRAVADETLVLLASCDCFPDLDFRSSQAIATAQLHRGDARAAIARFQRALRVDRRPELYMGLGVAFMESGDERGAIDSFARAVEFDPSRLAQVPYDDVRLLVKQRVVAARGAGWMSRR